MTPAGSTGSPAPYISAKEIKPDGLTGQQSAGVDQTVEVFSQFPGVPRAQVSDSKPAFQPFAKKFGKAGAVVAAAATNPARMILRAEPAT
jgi:hypothetical protein